MLITMSPNFFADHLGARGIDVVRASRFPPLPFAAPVDPAGILNPADKVRLAEAERRPMACRATPASPTATRCRTCRCSRSWTTPSRSTPTPSSSARPRVVYRGEDLREAYAHGRSLLDAGAPDDGGANR